MFNYLTCILMLLVSSCKAPTSHLNANNEMTAVSKSATVISATVTRWHGGVRGVSGSTYVVTLKNNFGDAPVFKEMFAEGNRLTVSQKKEKNTYVITASFTSHSMEMVGEPAPSQIKQTSSKSGNWLSYTEGSGGVKKISLPNFREMPADENEEKIP